MRVENLLFGFLRLLLCLGALMVALSSVLSLSTVAGQQSEDMEAEPMTVTVVTAL